MKEGYDNPVHNHIIMVECIFISPCGGRVLERLTIQGVNDSTTLCRKQMNTETLIAFQHRVCESSDHDHIHRLILGSIKIQKHF